MFAFLSNRNNPTNVPEQIYGVVVARARDTRFFTEFSMPDTVMGRFDVLAMHVFLFCRRMKQEDNQISLGLSQDVFDLFVSDVERALRELGVGDTVVPKRKKKMVRSFYGQIDDFDNPLDAEDMSVLSAAVCTRFFDNKTGREAVSKSLAQYMLDTAWGLGELEIDRFTTANFSWPDFKKESVV
ncbi:MAG: ubiquinol-cytochrome C chaperone family protein [Rhizobiaceae bacterium]